MPKLITRRRLGILGLSCLVLLLAGELVARFGIGLGDPPLSVEHPTIEYMFAPNQDCKRFGNRVHINAYGMRSPDFPKEKSDPEEFRVMVLGDSVINGGSLSDQSQLATTLLQQELTQSLNRPVVVGNISAGSWGPANLLAYAQTFGFFDADVILIVVSSHDARDVPTFEPLSPNSHPTKAPRTALGEGVARYLPRYLPSRSSNSETNASPYTTQPADPESLDAFLKLLGLAKESGARVAVIQHWTRDELTANQPEPGHAELAKTAEDLGIPTYQTAEHFRQADDPAALYRDHIHPTAMGQTSIQRTLHIASSE